MQVLADDVAPVARRDLTRVRSGISMALLFALLVLVALQRGGYYAESWALPAAACGWLVAVVALVGGRQRLRRLELAYLAGLALLASLALISTAWAPGGLGSALPQAQLVAFYLSAVCAVLMLFRRAAALVMAVWAALAIVSLASLGTKLFPSDASSFSNLSGNRLFEPIGYWNSLGLWSAMGLCVATALLARGRLPAVRAVAAASTVPSATCLYFTFSRGAWVALAIGLIAALAVDPRRLGYAAWLCLTAPWAAMGILLASRAHSLTSVNPDLAEAQSEGRPLALALVALSVAAALATTALVKAERRVSAHELARRVFAGAIAVLCVLGLLAVMLRFGAPWTIAEQAAHKFGAPPQAKVDDLNSRLFDASGSFRVDLWRVAWDDATRHPLAGSGAGSYAAEWFRERPIALDATNAHQLYLETLAELGPLGLAFLLVALGAPLVAAWRARHHPLAAGVTAAYVAFLVHAAVDWDWQLAAVTLAALCCGAALLVMARGSRSSGPSALSRGALALAGVALAGFALWSLHGNLPLGQSRDAIDEGRWSAAEGHAAVAVARIGGSSALSWRFLGEAQTALRRREAARESLRVAVRRDPTSWEAWYDLAVVSEGAQRRTAASRALALNPLGPETRSLARATGITVPRANTELPGSQVP
jgi:hypothetical protein